MHGAIVKMETWPDRWTGHGTPDRSATDDRALVAATKTLGAGCERSNSLRITAKQFMDFSW